MIRVTCETFEWGWEVVITRVAGLKETPLHHERFQKFQLVDTPARAMHCALNNAFPETPEHS